jgi:hypothetical protein
MIDRCRKVGTNLENNDVPIELAARHVFCHVNRDFNVDGEGRNEIRRGV